MCLSTLTLGLLSELHSVEQVVFSISTGKNIAF